MTDYTKSTNFATKDSLPPGSALKIVRGTEIDTEFNAIATAVATKFDSSATLPVANGGTGATTASAARTALGVVIGTNVQAWDADLDTWAAKAAPSGTVVGTTDTQTLTNKTLTSPSISGAVMSSMASSVISSGTAVASTSGTSIDFTSIPSWVKRITVMFNVVSTNGTSPIQVQLGAGSVDTASYNGQISSGQGNNTNYTTGFYVVQSTGASASGTYYGQLVISLLGSNLWVASGLIGHNITASGFITSGVKTLSSTLDRVRITTVNGTDTFDAGSINILYE